MLALSVPAAAGGGYVLKAHVSAACQNTGDSVTTAAIDTTGCDLIVIGVCGTSFVSGDISDTKGNSWIQQVLSSTTSNSGAVGIYFKANPTVGFGHTFTVAANRYAVMFVLAFSGVVASPSGTINSAVAGAVTTIQPGSITPPFSNELIVTGCQMGGSGISATVNLGFLTPDAPIAGISGITYAGALAYLLQGTAAAINPTWTLGSASGAGNAAVIGCFKSVAS